jgi:ATP-dependent Clp protease ATP-binding subunit ClpB
VVLLDEIEKAHPDVFNILLQVLDDGRLTDNKGRTANFRNTLIIMTSNIGSHLIWENMKEYDDNKAEEVHEKTRNMVFDLLKQTLRPEFLNRIDEIIMFKPLTSDNIRDIVKLQLNDLQLKLSANNIRIEFTDKAVNWLAQQGYDPQYGARPLKRLIQKNILNEISRMIIGQEVSKNQLIIIDAERSGLSIKNSAIS